MLLNVRRRCTSIQAYLKELWKASDCVHLRALETRELGIMQIQKVCLRSIQPVRNSIYESNTDLFGTVFIARHEHDQFIHSYHQYLQWSQLKDTLECGHTEYDSLNIDDYSRTVQSCRSLRRLNIDGTVQLSSLPDHGHTWTNIIENVIDGTTVYPSLSQRDTDIDRVEIISCVASIHLNREPDYMSNVDFCIRGKICVAHCDQNGIATEKCTSICPVPTPKVYLDEIDSIIRQSINLDNSKIDILVRVD